MIAGDPGAGASPDEGATPALFLRCPECAELVYRKEVERRLNVCPRCGHHLAVTVEQRLRITVDRGSFEEVDAALTASDPLAWVDARPYTARVAAARDATGRNEALVTGFARVEEVEVALAIFDFRFLGGSMGTVVGEKFLRLAERACERRLPLLAFTASGGARMQEGTLSLFQMARVADAVVRLREAGLGYVCVLTDPTTGGVAASLAMLGDVQLAEPGARIGFAGRRVIEQTIGEKLPDDFQRAETVLRAGMIDRVVPRAELRSTLGRILRVLARRPRAPHPAAKQPP